MSDEPGGDRREDNRSFARLAFTDTVKALQVEHGSRDAYEKMAATRDDTALGWRERLFVEARDSIYMASVGSNGWPYVQHRGGPPGFLRVIDPTTLAFADFRGNRQYVSTGNVLDDGRVVLFLMDYPHRRRLKVWAEAAVVAPERDPILAEAVALDGYDAVVERIFELQVRSFDWNCTQHITPRFSEQEVGGLTRRLRLRIADLEAECAELRRLAAVPGTPTRRS